MSIKNQVVLVGHIGATPEVKELSNKKYCRFSLATNESYKNAVGEKVTETQWHSCTAWGKTAEFCEQLLQKGTFVLVTGKLTHRDYVDAQGVKRYITEVLINEFLVLSGRPE